MEVFVLIDYRKDKKAGKSGFKFPKVFATLEKVQDAFGDATVDILENISPREPIEDLVQDPDSFLFKSDWRYIHIYYKKVEVIE